MENYVFFQKIRLIPTYLPDTLLLDAIYVTGKCLEDNQRVEISLCF